MVQSHLQEINTASIAAMLFDKLDVCLYLCVHI
jgi:hypothetical protein